jgi:hypothetical protein
VGFGFLFWGVVVGGVGVGGGGGGGGGVGGGGGGVVVVVVVQERVVNEKDPSSSFVSLIENCRTKDVYL